MSRLADLVQGDDGIPGPAARRADHHPDREDRQVEQHRPAERSHARTQPFAGEPPREPARVGQQDQEVEEAEPERDRRELREVLVDGRLRRQRRQTGYGELLEEQGGAEHEVEADHGMDAHREHHEDRGRRHEEPGIATGEHDRRRVRARDRQRGPAQQDRIAARAYDVPVARAPDPLAAESGAHRETLIARAGPSAGPRPSPRPAPPRRRDA